MCNGTPSTAVTIPPTEKKGVHTLKKKCVEPFLNLKPSDFLSVYGRIFGCISRYVQTTNSML